MASRKISSFKILPLSAIILLILALASACTIPKRYQKNKPFIYRTNIQLTGQLPSRERQDLREKLANQIDDSLKVRTVMGVRLVPPFFFYKLDKPPAFDSLYVSRSKVYMDALLNAQGYFNPTITDTFTIDTVRDQQRVSVRFNVEPGKVIRIDSIGYDFEDTTLQALAIQSLDESVIKKNERYTLGVVSNELDRLLNTFRNNGYYKIAKEDFYAEHDTVVAALIDPTLDPFEQLELLDSLQRKKENPTISIVFKQRVVTDSTHFDQFHIGNVTVYPDASIFDTTGNILRKEKILGIDLLSKTRNFKHPFVARNISLRPGELYRIDNYFKTINTFTNLGAWQQVSIDLHERADSLSILDPVIKLFPAKRQNLNISFETSRNENDILATGSLFGLGLNLGLNNKNVFRESIQSNTNLRVGVELGSENLIQTVQTSASHSIFIPRLIVPFRSPEKKSIASGRTVLNINASYTNRRDFFQARSINTSWGYDWTRKNHNWQYIPFNFEFTTVDETDSLNRLKLKYPSLAFAFNDGLIISQILTYNQFKTREGFRRAFQARLEESGALFGLIRRLDRGDLQRFIKADIEYKYFILNRASTWAFRIFGGYGYSYGMTGDKKETNLPFFKSYFGGGPYSMRAWRVRQLGLGSNVMLDSTGSPAAIDRFGDIKLEGNIEYRFDIGTAFGFKIQSALFTDIGNVWLRDDQGVPELETAEFNINRLYKDLAVAGGTSLRIDFNFFLIRLDWAYKLKNPYFSNVKNGWFQDLHLKDGQFQLGIGYPF